MCLWEGSAKQRYFWICGCSPLPRFASSLSPRLTPPSSDPQTVHFLGKHLRTFSQPVHISYHMKLSAVIGCSCYPILFKDRAVFLF